MDSIKKYRNGGKRSFTILLTRKGEALMENLMDYAWLAFVSWMTLCLGLLHLATRKSRLGRSREEG